MTEPVFLPYFITLSSTLSASQCDKYRHEYAVRAPPRDHPTLLLSLRSFTHGVGGGVVGGEGEGEGHRVIENLLIKKEKNTQKLLCMYELFCKCNSCELYP